MKEKKKSTIELVDIDFFAYHGVYNGERRLGNLFRVSVKIDYDFEQSAIDDDLSATIDYQTVYNAVADVMQKPVNLLETVAVAINNAVYAISNKINLVEVSVAKQNPPIGGVCRWARVTYTQ